MVSVNAEMDVKDVQNVKIVRGNRRQQWATSAFPGQAVSIDILLLDSNGKIGAMLIC